MLDIDLLLCVLFNKIHMKVLFVSINASFMHTNPAIRSLACFAKEHLKDFDCTFEIEIKEYTINQGLTEVLHSIALTNSDVVLFSTYIWNAEYTANVILSLKSVLKNCIIGAGGPEFSYGYKKYLTDLADLDFIMAGEGENTVCEVIAHACNGILLQSLPLIKGLYYRDEKDCIEYSSDRPLIQNLDDLPFVYPEILKGDYEKDNKIYYYESTRGCPFSCAYCLSSVDKRVRFKSLDKVKHELKIFLDANVKLVKFIDRTYNLNSDRYIPIWQYIIENHNGKTMFHFEIEAEYLSDEALVFLQTVPPGVMQFEMGVQSANKKTLKAVNRSDNIQGLASKIRRIPRTIHQHLDLIAGLPYEDLLSFGKSYDYVMALKPDALQLGFLKVLDGTLMADIAQKNGWQWMHTPVYETLSTPYLSFNDIVYLKHIEKATDVLWNNKIFETTFYYIFDHTSPWQFVCSFVDYAIKKQAFAQARNNIYWFALLNDYADDVLKDCDDYNLIKDLIRYDYIKKGKKGSFPSWYKRRYRKDRHLFMLEKQDLNGTVKALFSVTEYEKFDYDVTSETPMSNKGEFELLITYDSKKNIV